MLEYPEGVLFMKDSIDAIKVILAQRPKIAVLTGAGISAESGVPTFRGSDGYWKGKSAEDLASMQGFSQDPHGVWEWYNLRRHKLKDIKPNPGHDALVKLEEQASSFTLVTQNVDRLHQQAGSGQVLELHGSIWPVRCMDCDYQEDRFQVDLPAEPRCPDCKGWLRPGVVWFGEALPFGIMEKADHAVRMADLFFIIGTSAVVWPAAGLAWTAREAGAKVVEINLEETPATEVAHISLLGKSGEILPQFL